MKRNLVGMYNLLAVMMGAGHAHAANDFDGGKTMGIVGFLADAKKSRLNIGPIPAKAIENGHCQYVQAQSQADR